MPKLNKTKTVFVNGVFDIVHPGHLALLKFGRSLGDKLIVGINSDRAVKILKGPKRPINQQKDRQAFLQALDLIDKVIIFDDVRIGKIVAKLRPDILVQSDDHTPEQIRKVDGITSDLEIKLFPRIKKFSTTNIVKKVIQNNKRT